MNQDLSGEYLSDSSGEYLSDFSGSQYYDARSDDDYEIINVSNKFDGLKKLVSSQNHSGLHYRINTSEKEDIENVKILNLRNLYDNFQSMKNFYTINKTIFDDKKLYYKHNEDFINIGSLDNINIDTLKHYYIKSTYGNYETGLNEFNLKMRKSFEIDLKNIYTMKENQFKNILYSDLNIDLNQNFIKENDKVYKSVIINNPYYYESYKMIIYEEGCFFNRHTDSLSSKNMIGTLIYGLTNDYEGGEFVVYNNSDSKTFKIKKNEWIFIYGNCPHEVLPVKSGTRITITFKIFKNLHNINLSEYMLLSTNVKLNNFIDELKIFIDYKFNYENYGDLKFYFSMCYDYTSTKCIKDINSKHSLNNSHLEESPELFKEIENYLIDVDLIFFNKLKETFYENFNIYITRISEELHLDGDGTAELFDTLLMDGKINHECNEYYIFKNSNSLKTLLVKSYVAGNAVEPDYFVYQTYVIVLHQKSHKEKEEFKELKIKNGIKSAKKII